MSIVFNLSPVLVDNMPLRLSLKIIPHGDRKKYNIPDVNWLKTIQSALIFLLKSIQYVFNYLYAIPKNISTNHKLLKNS